jgi:hypothetical protein
MIDIARDNNSVENEPPTSTAVSDDWEELDASQEDTASWESLSDPEESVGEAPVESEPYPRDPLEGYLLKLLAPTADAPRERVPHPADEAPWDETPALEKLDVPAPQEPPDFGELSRAEVVERPRETRPLWQTMDTGVPELPVPAARAHPAAEPAPADTTAMPAPERRPLSKPQKRTAIRSFTKKEQTGSGRHKLVTWLIPVLVIALVVVLKHPLGARSAAKAVGGPPLRMMGPVSADVQIAWEVPSPYDLAGRDPMKGTTPPVVAVEDNGTAAPTTEPLVELVVTGILYSPDNPAAIVDTQVVHEGEQISGATVEKIEKDGIQFERNGRRWKQTVAQQ